MKTTKWLFLMAAPLLFTNCKKDNAPKVSETGDELISGTAVTGNGAPSGPHYNLNIIGVANPKKFDYNAYEQQNTTGQGRRIFVPLDGTAKINLKEGDFAVLDANGTDGTAAFQLPAPDPDGDGITSYSVFVRGLGKPGGTAKMQSCMTETVDVNVNGVTDTYCSTTQQIDIAAHSNNNKFTNVSKQLLYVYADTNGDGVLEKIPLFGDPLYTYYWDYQNTGLKLAQLRFYDVPTNTN